MEMDASDSELNLDSGFDDIDIKGDVDMSESSEVMEESSSLEELAGLMPKQLLQRLLLQR